MAPRIYINEQMKINAIKKGGVSYRYVTVRPDVFGKNEQSLITAVGSIDFNEVRVLDYESFEHLTKMELKLFLNEILWWTVLYSQCDRKPFMIRFPLTGNMLWTLLEHLTRCMMIQDETNDSIASKNDMRECHNMSEDNRMIKRNLRRQYTPKGILLKPCENEKPNKQHSIKMNQRFPMYR